MDRVNNIYIFRVCKNKIASKYCEYNNRSSNTLLVSTVKSNARNDIIYYLV